MAKSKTGVYGLKFGHDSEFRRTIKAKEPYQLVFQPGKGLELTAEEVKGLDKEIKAGLLVEWEEDDKGRQVRPGPRPPEVIPHSERTPDIEHKIEPTGAEAAEAASEEAKRSQKIDDLELSEGTKAALRDAGLTTVRKIEAHLEKHGDFTDVPGIGDAKSEEIHDAILNAGR